MWFEDIYVFRIAWMYVKIYDVLYIYLQMQGVHRTHTHTHISCLDVEGSVLFSFAILSYSILSVRSPSPPRSVCTIRVGSRHILSAVQADQSLR